MLLKHAPVLALALVLIATLRIIASWQVFNATNDEPAHIGCGMEWLDRHTYLMEDQHPPLARVAVALGPYLFGVGSQGFPEYNGEGQLILKAQGKLDRNLKASRAGILPFFWIACGVVFLATRFLFGPLAALVAVLLWTNLPAVLAHGALATTDMAVTSMLGATGLAVAYWFQAPFTGRAALMGLAGSLAVLSKFSAVPFLIFGILAIFIWDPKLVYRIYTRHVWHLALAAVVAVFVIWAMYRFSNGPVRGGESFFAPEFISGLITVKEHNEKGHPAYLFGSFSRTGFWSYYPVVLLVKTPLGFLALAVVGAIFCWRARRQDLSYGYWLASSAGILFFCIVFSRINIGVRHILPVYLGLSVTAAFAVTSLQLKRWGAVVAGALCILMVGSSVYSHPDYLPYFNELVGAQPERILIDSDLDWGQDMNRLGIRLNELHIQQFHIMNVMPLDLSVVPFPSALGFDLEHAEPGWHAAHIQALKTRQFERLAMKPGAKFWTDEVPPLERVGKGILLWHIQ